MKHKSEYFTNVDEKKLLKVIKENLNSNNKYKNDNLMESTKIIVEINKIIKTFIFYQLVQCWK